MRLLPQSVGFARGDTMKEKPGSWRKKIKQHWVAIVVVVTIAIVAVIVSIVLAYQFDWTGFNSHIGPKLDQNQQYRPEKTLWDWLQLLIIPLVLAVGALLFNLANSRTEQQIAQDNQSETALQAYIDKMSALLLEKCLRTSQKKDDVREVARVRTLRVLPGLDNERKRSVIQFLHESQLICKDNPILLLNQADLRKASLDEAELKGANLSGAKLMGANLIKANLNGAFLIKANLSNAKLQGANLSDADLSGANLKGANYNTKRMKWKDVHGNPLTLKPTKWQGAKYNTKPMQGTDVHGNPLTLEPTQWPQGFDLVKGGLICV